MNQPKHSFLPGKHQDNAPGISARETADSRTRYHSLIIISLPTAVTILLPFPGSREKRTETEVVRSIYKGIVGYSTMRSSLFWRSGAPPNDSLVCPRQNPRAKHMLDVSRRISMIGDSDSEKRRLRKWTALPRGNENYKVRLGQSHSDSLAGWRSCQPCLALRSGP